MSKRVLALAVVGIVLLALTALFAHACQPMKPPAPVEYTIPQTVEKMTTEVTHEATQEPTALPDTGGSYARVL